MVDRQTTDYYNPEDRRAQITKVLVYLAMVLSRERNDINALELVVIRARMSDLL